ncbi:AI-2E family transporter [Polymorphobacter arshaanensis]|uniref:AI-2E family transporter n=1 Tax=Glacieibacterium arshaanense TaxID=2511025 RepID=A0A4Y9ENF4_9SPHN|nr:AI-2E family transporter [Polymorphobacter arshaanensis]TFU03606.1 AI-2E family transporter [Polymorphobacter arshaanensis]
MARKPATPKPPPAPLTASPIEPHSERGRNALRDASIWIGMAAFVWLAWKLAPMLMLIIGGLVVAAALQGAERQLGRIWRAPMQLRMAVVVTLLMVALTSFVLFASYQLAEQYAQLRSTLTVQFATLAEYARGNGVDLGEVGRDPFGTVQHEFAGSLGSVRETLGSFLSAVGSIVFMLMIGIYVAVDPRIYERGIEWLTPEAHRADMAETVKACARTLRHWIGGRLLAMAIEGSIMFVGLWAAGVPLAGLLGLTSGLLAFIPTLGPMIAGVVVVAMGFSAGVDTGLWALAIFAFVQFLEGYVLTPIIEKRVVDLAPAVVLAAQLLFGVLFGIIGVALADPIVAMAKVALSHRSTATHTEE